MRDNWFELDEDFIAQFVNKQPNWGPVGYVTYKRTYARDLETVYERHRDLGYKAGLVKTEEFWLTMVRVVEGAFTILQDHCRKLHVPWDVKRAQYKAQDMYHHAWDFKWLPPGRGLWMMGTPIVERLGGLALNNCAFTSTQDIKNSLSTPFCMLMDYSMLGVGVGFDTRGAGTLTVRAPRTDAEAICYVQDSREGWVDALRAVLDAYSLGDFLPKFDFSQVRPAGLLIKGFGGTSSGPQPLKEMLESIGRILQARVGQAITSSDLTDIGNLIGRCVVAGNVRRCLPGGSLVHTEQGLQRIENVSVGTRVLTSGQHGDKYAAVTEVLTQGKQQLINVATQMGTLRCTANHRVAVLTSATDYSFKNAGELQAGDRLVFVDAVIPGQQTKMPEWSYVRPKHSTTCQDIRVPELDQLTAWYLGHLLGNGYVYANRDENGFNAYVSSSLNNDEYHDEIVDRLRSMISRFGVNINEVEPSTIDNSRKVRAQSKQLAWYLDENFKQPNIPLNVPTCVLNGLPKIRAAFLAGLLDSDGSVKTRPVQCASSVYPDFLRQVQTVYASLGIPTRIELHRESQGEWQALYNLNLVGEDARSLFMERVQPYAIKKIIPGKTERSQNDYGYPARWCSDLKYGKQWSSVSRQMTTATWRRCGGLPSNLVPIEVKSVSIGEFAETYDLSVETAHEFVVDGLLVHNSAEIVFGDPTDEEFLDLKNPEKNGAALASHRWASNNSTFVSVGQNYSKIAALTGKNGEPGYLWLENARRFGRMIDEPNNRDEKALGCNPCAEQTLEDSEVCCLVETFPFNHTTSKEFQRTLKHAYLYAKVVTLLSTHNERTNAVMLKNRRIGCSMSGIVQAMKKFGRREFLSMCDESYAYIQELDKEYSGWLCIPRSIKTTSVKPSGTVSLLVGATPGIHHPHSQYYWRVIRFRTNSVMLPALQRAGYRCIEISPEREPNTTAVYFPVEEKGFDRSQGCVSMWEQLEIAAALQAHWADNQVSCTVTFDKLSEGSQICQALELYEERLKSVSFLPKEDHGYIHAPYQFITKEIYEEAVASLKPLDLRESINETQDKFCDGDKCQLRS